MSTTTFFEKPFFANKIIVALSVIATDATKSFIDRQSHGFVLQSDCEATYIFSDGTILNVSPDDFFYLPKHSNYTVKKQSQTNETFQSCFCINYDSPDESIAPFKIKLRNVVNIRSLFIDATRTWSMKRTGFQERCMKDLYSIVYEIKNEQQYLPSSHYAIIQPAVDYICAHYTEKQILISTLATLCKVSESYFHRIFFKAYGKTPLQFINDLKLSYAKELLVSEIYSVKQVSELSGFDNEYYFSRFFKHHTGISPSKFK